MPIDADLLNPSSPVLHVVARPGMTTTLNVKETAYVYDGALIWLESRVIMDAPTVRVTVTVYTGRSGLRGDDTTWAGLATSTREDMTKMGATRVQYPPVGTDVPTVFSFSEDSWTDEAPEPWLIMQQLLDSKLVVALRLEELGLRLTTRNLIHEPVLRVVVYFDVTPKGVEPFEYSDWTGLIETHEGRHVSAVPDVHYDVGGLRRDHLTKSFVSMVAYIRMGMTVPYDQDTSELRDRSCNLPQRLGLMGANPASFQSVLELPGSEFFLLNVV